MESTKEALEKALSKTSTAIPELKAAYDNLGADKFKTREQAQRDLLRGGAATLDWLNSIERSKDPEVKTRVAEIRKTLSSPSSNARADAVRHAMRSLLAEGDERKRNTGGLLYEWFGENSKELDGRYRGFRLENSAKRGGKVADGKLIFSGSQGVDGDQRLVLTSQDWLGTPNFGKRFRVSAKLGGREGGSGAWHLGITVGKIRVLYHPGLRGGSFRLEDVTNNESVSDDINMDFTPSTESMQGMELNVRQRADGVVAIRVLIEQQGDQSGRFEFSINLDAETIGPLDQISLDRSGRTGGDAWFDDFTIDLNAP